MVLNSPAVFPIGVPSAVSISWELIKFISYLNEAVRLKKKSELELKDSPSPTSTSV